jgi:ABC-2 type transport system permease protein
MTTTAQFAAESWRDTIRPVGFSRLVAIEMRKSVDTRAARALLATALGVGALVLLLLLVLAGEPSLEIAAIPAALVSLVLPIIGVMSMTSEWSQRTALVTFWLVPRRSRVLAAKVTATMLLAVTTLAAMVVVFTVVCAIVFTIRGVPLDLSQLDGEVFGVLLSGLPSVVLGLAWGALLRSTALAIIVVIFYPLVVEPIVSAAIHDVGPWVSSATLPSLITGGSAPGAAIVTSIVLWYAAPLAGGWMLQLRREAR